MWQSQLLIIWSTDMVTSMDPQASKALFSLFPLLFQGQGSVSSTTSVSQGMGSTHVSVASPHLINVSQVSASTSGSPDQSLSIPIKVINPLRKRECKSYLLTLNMENITNLSSLKEEILEQLGKTVVSFDMQFDVGHFSGSQ